MPDTNLEAAQSGDRRVALEKARDTAAAAIDAAVARGDGTVAQLIAQYRATLADIAQLGEAQEESASVRLAKRIAAANSAA